MKDLRLNDLREYDALIFDLDGTILDSMEVWNEVDEIFLGKRGYGQELLHDTICGVYR